MKWTRRLISIVLLYISIYSPVYAQFKAEVKTIKVGDIIFEGKANL